MSVFGDFRKKLVEKLVDNLAGVSITALLTAGPWLLRQIPLLKPYLQSSVPIWCRVPQIAPFYLGVCCLSVEIGEIEASSIDHLSNLPASQ
jgi:hypothetical protein